MTDAGGADCYHAREFVTPEKLSASCYVENRRRSPYGFERRREFMRLGGDT